MGDTKQQDKNTQTPNDAVQTDVQPQDAVAPQKTRKKRHWLGFALVQGGMLASLAGVFGGGAWLLDSESGLRFALHTVPSWFQVQIASDNLKGTLLDGFSGENWRIRTADSEIAIDSIDLQWQPSRLWERHLHVQRLAVGNIHIDSKPGEPKSSEPVSLPERISLPFSVQADELSLGKISSGSRDNVLLKGLKAAYRYNHQAHELTVHSLQSPWSESRGSLRAATQKPFALDGELQSQGLLDDIAVESRLKLGGSLQEVLLQSTLSGHNIALDVDTKVSPFAQTLQDMIGHVRISGKGINPKAFLPSLPQAQLHFEANVLPNVGDVIALDGTLKLHNAQAAPADRNGIPVRRVDGQFVVDETGVLRIAKMEADLLQQGRLQLGGQVDTAKKTLNVSAQISQVRAADVLAARLDGTLNGQIRAEGSFDKPQAVWQLNTGRADTDGVLKIHTDAHNGQRTLLLEKGRVLPHGGGELDVSGSLELFKQQRVQVQVGSRQFNPAKLYPAFPEGSVNGTVKLDGELAKQVFHADMQFQPSVLSGAALSGGGKVSYEQQHLSRADVAVRLGSNVLNTSGSFGKRGDVLRVDIDAPELHRFGFGIQGALQAKGSVGNVSDGWTDVSAELDGQARRLSVPGVAAAEYLDFRVKASPDANRPLLLDIQGRQLQAGGSQIEQVAVLLDGTLRQHKLSGSGSLKADGKPLRLNVAAAGGFNEQSRQWQGTVSSLDVAGALNLKLQNSLSLQAGQERVQLGAARWQALGGQLDMDSFVWDKHSGIRSKGSAVSLRFGELHTFYTPPVEHNLVLSGDWDLSYGQSPGGYLNLRQQSGDIVLPTARQQPLGLSGLVLQSRFSGNGIQNQFEGNTRFGKAKGNVEIRQVFGGDISQAPLSGTVRLDADDLHTLRSFMPVGQTVRGKLWAEAVVGGRVGEPKLNGSISGEKLYYRNHDVGVILDNGTLRSRLDGQKWVVEALTFRNDKGAITLSGTAALGKNGEPDVDADVVFDRYEVLSQPRRRLTVSGNTKLRYGGKGLSLEGDLKTDEGRFGFQDSGMPTVDDDVVVLGEQIPEKSTAMPIQLNLGFDLNDKFRFSGQGLDVTLGGKLQLTAQPGSDVRGVGSVHVVKGQFKAYGQDLAISKGVISFVGPLDRPNLNIRAERRNSSVGAGVEVLGNLNQPRVSLVANEPMSEKDKLSWLILNRASSGSSGDEAALATAAGALLAGNINDRIGLVDDFGLTTQQRRNAQTGEMNPAQQVLTFGKQLTRDLYIGYEAGLGNASQSVKFVYQLSRSLQAVLRAGTQSSGGEVRYTKRFD